MIHLNESENSIHFFAAVNANNFNCCSVRAASVEHKNKSDGRKERDFKLIKNSKFVQV